MPAGPGIRDDSGAAAGSDVPIFYDPMISKLVAWAEDRPRAIARMRRALDEYLVTGIKTTVPFFQWLLAQPEFIGGRFHTTYLDEVLEARAGRPFVEPGPGAEEFAAIAVALQLAVAPVAAAARAHGGRHGTVARARPHRRAPGVGRRRPRAIRRRDQRPVAPGADGARGRAVERGDRRPGVARRRGPYGRRDVVADRRQRGE